MKNPNIFNSEVYSNIPNKEEQTTSDCNCCGSNDTRCSLPKLYGSNNINVTPTYCNGSVCSDPSGYSDLFSQKIGGLTISASYKVHIGTSLDNSYICFKLTLPIVGELHFEVSKNSSIDYHYTTPFLGIPYIDFVAYLYENEKGVHCLHVCADLKVPGFNPFVFNQDVICLPF
ncbi:hypothetical protein CN465_25345 [Bacillus cereus]|nr:hypothetical protein CN465_25345 [Bacillus cereus]